MTGKLNVFNKRYILLLLILSGLLKRSALLSLLWPFQSLVLLHIAPLLVEFSVLHITDAHPFLFSSFEDPGPVGNGRYSEHMLPEIEMRDFRKGAQVYLHVLSKVIICLWVSRILDVFMFTSKKVIWKIEVFSFMIFLPTLGKRIVFSTLYSFLISLRHSSSLTLSCYGTEVVSIYLVFYSLWNMGSYVIYSFVHTSK